MNKNSASPIIKPSDILQTLINSEGSKKIKKIHLPESYTGTVKAMRGSFTDIAVKASKLIVGDSYRSSYPQIVGSDLIRYLVKAKYQGIIKNGKEKVQTDKHKRFGWWVKAGSKTVRLSFEDLGEYVQHGGWGRWKSMFVIRVETLRKSKVGFWIEEEYFETGKNANAAIVTHLENISLPVEIKNGKSFFIDGYKYTYQVAEVEGFGTHVMEIIGKYKGVNYHLPEGEFESMSHRAIHKKLSRLLNIKIKEKEEAKLIDLGPKKPVSFKLGLKLGFCKTGMQRFCDVYGFDIKRKYTANEIFTRVENEPTLADEFESELFTLANTTGYQSFQFQ